METNEKIVGSLITIALLISIGVNVLPDATHYCADRQMTYHCDSLSKYYGLPNGKCINDVLSNKLCTSGWEEINYQPEPSSESVIAPSQSKGKQWLCSPGGCEELN